MALFVGMQCFVIVLFTSAKVNAGNDDVNNRVNTKAVLSKGNRAMPQMFFSV